MPLVSRTRATLRKAEFGFLGVVVYTRVHTPRRCGAPLSAGVLPLAGFDSRPLRTNCWMVGTNGPFLDVQRLVAERESATGPRVNATRPRREPQTPRSSAVAAAPGPLRTTGRGRATAPASAGAVGRSPWVDVGSTRSNRVSRRRRPTWADR